MDILLIVGITILAAMAAAGATAFYFWRRTTLRLRSLSLLVKRLAMGDLEQRLDNLKLAEEGELVELAQAITQLSHELRSVIQRVSAERNTMVALLQNMSDGIISTDGEGRVTNINEAARRILNLAPHVHLENRPFMQVVRDYELNSLLRQTLQDGQTRVQDLEVGPRHPQLQVRVTLVHEETNADGTPANSSNRSALVVLQDLTELMRLERVRRDFVANISHELRTPLASVKLMVETLQNVLEEDPSAAHQFLTRIDTEVDGLTQLVRELLELSRIESGQVKLNLKSTDLCVLVEQAADRLKPQAARRGLSIAVAGRGKEESFPTAQADPDRLMQVLINLIHNAIKFTPVGGTITLGVERYHGIAADQGVDHLLVRVSDTGVGIPSEDLDRIFERFYKVDKARAGNETGTGLGLAIAKHIIQAHGGEIWAESRVGAGSTFIFTLPVFSVS
jgi:two-component system, OmpR family, phosphate regulon sensor histidine kinase PhoR